jgi:hypothetical protein
MRYVTYNQLRLCLGFGYLPSILMVGVSEVIRGRMGSLLSKTARRERWRVQRGGSLWAAGCKQVVDQFGGAAGSAQDDSLKACLVWVVGLGGVDDELFA